MAIRKTTRTARQQALLERARRSLITRTARIWSRAGRLLLRDVAPIVQSWVKKVFRAAEWNIDVGEFLDSPELPSGTTKAIWDTLRMVLAQGYWLQHIYMRECEAAMRGRTFRGRVTLADNVTDPDDELRDILESFINSRRVEVSTKWHSIIPRAAVEWLKNYIPSLAGVLQQDILESVRQVIRDSMTRGTTLDQRMKDLQAAEPKIAAMAKHRVEAIARTEITRADTMGRLSEMKSNPDVLAVEFCAVLDSRTSEICKERHGLIIRLDLDSPDALNLLYSNTPPLHPNCRSLLLPVTIYEHPDGQVQTSPEFANVQPGIQRPEDIAAVRLVMEGE